MHDWGLDVSLVLITARKLVLSLAACRHSRSREQSTAGSFQPLARFDVLHTDQIVPRQIGSSSSMSAHATVDNRKNRASPHLGRLLQSSCRQYTLIQKYSRFSGP